MSKIEVKYLKYKSEFDEAPKKPFGAHKVFLLNGERLPYKGILNNTIFTVALVVDGVQGKPFEYTEDYTK